MLVRYNKNNMYGIMGFTFMTGVNQVDEKLFNRMKKYKAFQFRIDKGIIEVVDSEDAPSKANDGKSAYAGKSIKEMENLIAQIFKRELLEQIKAEDTRKEVHKAVDEQIKKTTLSDEEKEKATESRNNPDK